MKKEEFGYLVKALRASYPANNILDNRDELMIWYEKLKEISYDVASKVIDEMISGMSVYPPTLPQIMAKCKERMFQKLPTANEAWMIIENAASKYGIYHWDEAMKEVPSIVMNAARGQMYRDICLSENRESVRIHFMSVYKENLEQIKENRILGLSGSSAEDNMKLLQGITAENSGEKEEPKREETMKNGMTSERLMELKRKHGLIT